MSMLLAVVLSLCTSTSVSFRNASLLSAPRQGKSLEYPSFVSGNCPFQAKRKCPVSLLAGRVVPSPISFTACAKSCANVPGIDNGDVQAWTNGLWAKFLGFKNDFTQKPSEVLSEFAKLEHLIDGIDGMQAEETFNLMERWVNSDHVKGSLRALVKKTGHYTSNLLDRATWTPYREKLWQGKKVVIVGGGPIGLRMAVEAAMLGADVTLGDARDGWTRANVMKMWPVAKSDLESIGFKEFNLLSGDFPICNIAVMQHAMLRIALVLGVNVEIMKFKELRDNGQRQYGAVFEKNGQELPPISFDAIFDASGVRGSLVGSKVNGKSIFNRGSDASGSKRVAITANFERFREDKDKRWAYGQTSITAVGAKYLDDKIKYGVKPRVEIRDLVWFQSVLSNYVVMALDLEEIQEKFPNAIKDSGVSRADLLRGNNINFDELLKLVMEVVDDWRIPYEMEDGKPKMLEGINKLAIFDFMGGGMSKDHGPEGKVSMIQTLPSGQHVLAIGDSLRAPFWPEGTGMSRGILSVMHAGFILTKIWQQTGASVEEEAKSWAYLAAYAAGEACKNKCGDAAVKEYVLRGYRGDTPPSNFGNWM